MGGGNIAALDIFTVTQVGTGAGCTAFFIPRLENVGIRIARRGILTLGSTSGLQRPKLGKTRNPVRCPSCGTLWDEVRCILCGRTLLLRKIPSTRPHLAFEVATESMPEASPELSRDLTLPSSFPEPSVLREQSVRDR